MRGTTKLSTAKRDWLIEQYERDVKRFKRRGMDECVSVAKTKIVLTKMNFQLQTLRKQVLEEQTKRKLIW